MEAHDFGGRGSELPREETRSRLQDLIGPTQLAAFSFSKLEQTLSLVCRDARPLTGPFFQTTFTLPLPSPPPLKKTWVNKPWLFLLFWFLTPPHPSLHRSAE